MSPRKELFNYRTSTLAEPPEDKSYRAFGEAELRREIIGFRYFKSPLAFLDDGVAGSDVAELVARAQDGDPTAFGTIYDLYSETVFRYVYFRVNNAQLAEDLTSETFLRALRRLSSFGWQGRAFGAWLVTIARNLIVDHFKSGRYRLEIVKPDVFSADAQDADPAISPETAALERLTNATLLMAIKKLNSDQQELIVLRFLQGRTIAEIARILGKGEGAIKTLQYRAVRTLARLLPDGFLG